MGKMTESTIKNLYKYGKLVYKGELSIIEATQRVVVENPEVAESSAEHYINWYKRMREGNFLSWNTNASLLKYYVSKVIEEEDSVAGELAIKSARQYAKHKNLKELDNYFVDVAKQNKLALLSLSIGSNIDHVEPTLNEEANSSDAEKEVDAMKEKLKNIKNYITNKGFSYDSDLIENFYLCLKSKPFVLLAGTSGTGKTRLVRLFAEAIGALEDNRYLQVAVKPDWSDSTDLFGHINLDGKFVAGAIIDFIKRASEDNDDLPYILCLDEMNLARVEYYLSDFLSVMETRDWNEKHIVTDKLIPSVCYMGDSSAEALYSDLRIPENLYIVGTVNMDETTFPFSKKVLDRANTIEFSYVDLTLDDHEFGDDVGAIAIGNEFLRSNYLRIKTDCKEQWESVKTINQKIISINEVLKEADLHFGYRMRDDIVFYMLYREEYNLLNEDKAFDNQILQKVLPRIQGSSESLAMILKRLFIEICAGPYQSKNGVDDSYKMENYLKDGGYAKYPRSAEKIWKMLRRFEEDDFTSFWS